MATRKGRASVPGSPGPPAAVLVGGLLDLHLERRHLALVRVAQGLHDVADGDDADEPALVHDREVADASLGHGVADRLQVVVGDADHHVTGHQLGDRAAEELLVAGGGAHDVALGEDADRPPGLVHDDHGPDVVLGQQREGLADRLLRTDGDHPDALAGQDVRDVHGASSQLEWAVSTR